MAGVLTPTEIAEFRALVESLAMPDAYSLKRDANTPDGAGGWTPVESTVEAGDCDLTAGATRPDERALAERMTSVTPYVITLRYDTIATASDRIAIGSRVFEILGILKDGFLGIDARAVCEERL